MFFSFVLFELKRPNNNIVFKKSGEIFYEEVCVYKPVLPQQDDTFLNAKQEIHRMIEKSRETNPQNQQNSANNSSRLPEILLYYVSQVTSGVASVQAAQFLWRSCHIQDFSETMFDLAGYVFERMYFRHQRISFERQTLAHGKQTQLLGLDEDSIEGYRSLVSSAPNSPRTKSNKKIFSIRQVQFLNLLFSIDVQPKAYFSSSNTSSSSTTTADDEEEDSSPRSSASSN